MTRKRSLQPRTTLSIYWYADDSRSLMSYPRHEYFRRILYNILGNDIERGYLPSEMDFGALLPEVCYKNAKDYFDL